MELQVKQRTEEGRAVRHLREKGHIPAVFYGRGMENQNLAVENREFERVFGSAGESSIITLVMGEEKRPVLVHDVQRDPITRNIVHIDFYGVRMDEKIKAHVPLAFSGEPPAVKEKEGVLNRTLSELEVEALPGDLPHELEIDISSLSDIGQSIRVGDVGLPEGVVALADAEAMVVSISAPQVVEEEPVSTEADVSDVKVEGEEKKAGQDEPKAENST